MQDEPVMNSSYLAGLLVTLVKVIMVALVTLGYVDLTDGEQAAIMAVVMVVADTAIVVATMYFGARPKVTPVSNPKAENTRGELVQLAPIDGSKLPR